jgi:bifunctional NMN adenylyltransferase/nudix hydrolase
METKRKIKIGAAPMRLQTPYMHMGHLNLIDTMYEENDIVVILLGVSPIKLSKRNPLDFQTRKLMVLNEYPKTIVLPLYDVLNSDEAWSANLDSLIKDMNFEGCNGEYEIDVTLYGSRDSFIPHYSGEFRTKEIAEVEGNLSSTELRDLCKKTSLDTRGFRRGVIYATNDRFNISYQTVDAFIVSDDYNILLGRKPNSTKYCLIGGFVEPSNASFEDAIIREVREETGLVVASPKYLFSQRVNDIRYKREDDKIMTAVFLVNYNGDESLAKANDDIEEVRWFNINEINGDMIVDAHKIIIHKIFTEIFKFKVTI